MDTRSPTSDRADPDLLQAARAGDAAALEELLLRHQPRVYRFGRKLCRDPEDASDVLQETLLAMARTIHDFRGASSLSTWLYTIARSFCIKTRRKRKFAPAREESLEGMAEAERERLRHPARAPDEDLAGREIREALEAAIASLEPGYREALVLARRRGSDRAGGGRGSGPERPGGQEPTASGAGGRPQPSGPAPRRANGSGRPDLSRRPQALLAASGGRRHRGAVRPDGEAPRDLRPLPGHLRLPEADTRSLPSDAPSGGAGGCEGIGPGSAPPLPRTTSLKTGGPHRRSLKRLKQLRPDGVGHHPPGSGGSICRPGNTPRTSSEQSSADGCPLRSSARR